MDFTELTAVFTMHSNAFKVMHWGAKGERFDTIHKVCEDYYNQTSADLDKLAEMAMRIGQVPCTAIQAPEVLNKSEHGYAIIHEISDFEYQAFVNNADQLLTDICYALVAIMDTDEIKNVLENVGIKADLEAMYNYYDLQHRYLNARRI